MDVWTIYERPRDYPDSYVVRAWTTRGGEPTPGPARTAPTLDAARKLVPRGMHRLPPFPGDDPVIVETWI
jgi:hypothetical protein